MKLKTKPLLDFIKLSSAVQTNSIIPIHKYIKLADGALSKTNGRTFICHNIDAPIEPPILLEENTFNAVVKFCKYDEIEITATPIAGSDEMKVTFMDADSVDFCQSPDAKLFDPLPSFDAKDVYDFDAEILQAIGSASKCVGNIGGNANLDFVYLYKGFIYGTDQQRIYSKKFSGIPDAIFDKDSAAVVSQFMNLQFQQSSNHNLFRTGKTLYGFQQYGDLKPLNLLPLIDRELSGDYFEIEVADLLRYCDKVSASIVLEGKAILECQLDGGEVFCLNDEYGKGSITKIPYKGNFKAKFVFNPKHLSTFLRSIGLTTIRLYDFYDVKNNRHVGFFVQDPDDKNFLGMISTIAKP